MLSNLQVIDVPVRHQDQAFAVSVDTLGFEDEDLPWAHVERFRDPDGNQLALQTALAQ